MRDRALPVWHCGSTLDWLILPGLALYQVLQEEGLDQGAALAETQELFEGVFGRLATVPRFLATLPDPFDAFRRVARTAIRAGFPPSGWDAEWTEDSDTCLAYNVRRCIYLEVLTSYGSPELTALYCRMDDLTFEGLPASITWERTKTLGQGGDVCDFRWCRAPAEEAE